MPGRARCAAAGAPCARRSGAPGRRARPHAAPPRARRPRRASDRRGLPPRRVPPRAAHPPYGRSGLSPAGTARRSTPRPAPRPSRLRRGAPRARAAAPPAPPPSRGSRRDGRAPRAPPLRAPPARASRALPAARRGAPRRKRSVAPGGGAPGPPRGGARARAAGGPPMAPRRQRPGLSRAPARAAVSLDDGVPRPLGLRQLGGRLRQRVEPLPEVLPVPGDHFELPVEQLEHRFVLRAERPLARGARAFGTELHDLVTLLLHFFVQLEQLGPFRVGVLAVAYPRGPLRLGGAVGRLEAFVDLPRLELGAGERLGDVLPLDEPTLEVAPPARPPPEPRFL